MTAALQHPGQIREAHSRSQDYSIAAGGTLAKQSRKCTFDTYMIVKVVSKRDILSNSLES